jgi:hypothetical protein
MGFAWDRIKTGERIAALAERWPMNEANELNASFAELSAWKAGRLITIASERLELAVNGLAMWLGYNDGEISGMVACPA